MSRAISVLHVADIINRYDFIDTVLRFCDRSRFRMLACTFTDKSNIEPPVYSDVPHYVLGIGSRRSYPRAVVELARILRRERVDIVHTHHFDPMMVGVTAARITGRIAVVGRHYSDSLHRLPSRWKRRVYLRIENLFQKAATRVIVPSSFIFRLLIDKQGVGASRVVQIPYGFDLAKYVPSSDGPPRLRRQFACDSRILIGCFGRLHPEKGHLHLLRAVRLLADAGRRFRVLIVGDGADRPELESTTREMDLADRVIFTGWRTDVVDLLAAVDMVVQPSVSGEGFSQVMIEALIMGKPLVVSDVSGARDAVRDGVNGLVVRPSDPAALAKAVSTLLENVELARRLGEAGRAYVYQNLDARSIVRRYEECYEAVYDEGWASLRN